MASEVADGEAEVLEGAGVMEDGCGDAMEDGIGDPEGVVVANRVLVEDATPDSSGWFDVDVGFVELD
jgi:hypothetical protein